MHVDVQMLVVIYSTYSGSPFNSHQCIQTQNTHPILSLKTLYPWEQILFSVTIVSLALMLLSDTCSFLKEEVSYVKNI